jgi:hypothetical protein
MRGGQTSPRAGTLADDLRRSTEDFESGTATEQAVYAQELERVHDLDKAREVRLLNVSEGLPPVLWFVLVNLGIDTILFTYSVGTKARWLHVLAVAALTGASPSYSSRYSSWIALLAGLSGGSRRVRAGVGHGRRKRHPITSSRRAVLERTTRHYKRARRQNRRGACPSDTS